MADTATLKKLVILGSTGSIGVNSLHVVDQFPGRFKITALSAHRNIELLLDQCRKFRPRFVAVTGQDVELTGLSGFSDLGITVFTGEDALLRLVRETEYDILVNAIVGAAGFMPTLTAVRLGRDIALANKETLVVGGQLVMAEAKKRGCTLLPIDSEHSAIFQCLMGEESENIEEILLTASGGPFRTATRDQMSRVTIEQALAHPNWHMGQKITIDSATMMNKGLEIIEAHWLFGVSYDRIRVVIHPQSIIHSMVAFTDGSIKAQLGVPDMRVPIQLALTYPRRRPSVFPRVDWQTLKEMTFDEPDVEKFRALALARQAGETGGTAPAVLNAANEEAVYAFLNRRIKFLQIERFIEDALTDHETVTEPSEDDLLAADEWARIFVRNKVKP